MSGSSQAQVTRVVFGVIAGWALLVLGVVSAGLGGRYSLHPDGASDALPALQLSASSGVDGDFGKFASIAERPLFNDNRRPIPQQASGAPVAAAPVSVPLNVVLTSVIITAKTRLAIVNDPASNKPQTIKPGQSLAGDQAAWKLVELEPRRAVFEGPGGRSSLDLRVFDGQGGEPPTPVAMPAAAGEQPGVVQESPETAGTTDTPESRAEMIRRRIEERRRQMREEAQRAEAERGK